VIGSTKLFFELVKLIDKTWFFETKTPARGELTGAGLVVREGDVQPSHTTTQAADSLVKSNGKPRLLVSDREMSQLNEKPRPG
jgi:hypothetical protein